MVTVISSSRYKINRKKIKELATTLLFNAGFDKKHYINIVFVGKKKMKDVSATYKNELVALPVLSFIYNEQTEGKRFLGEVLICYPQAVLMAARREKKVDAMMHQLIEHGIKNIIKELQK